MPYDPMIGVDGEPGGETGAARNPFSMSVIPGTRLGAYKVLAAIGAGGMREVISPYHPNIAAIYGVEDLALVLELLEGSTLAEGIAEGPIPMEEALPLIRQLLAAPEYAHEHGVIHRDLKPAKIKLTPDGRLKARSRHHGPGQSNEDKSRPRPAFPARTARRFGRHDDAKLLTIKLPEGSCAYHKNFIEA
jgi:serine/threonine protein kinase